MISAGGFTIAGAPGRSAGAFTVAGAPGRSDPLYREVPPPAHLAADVACLWVVETGGGHPAYRVLPDGCMDLVVQPATGAGGLRVEVVGAMNRHQNVPLPARQRVLGLRFRPGMAHRYLPLPAGELADRTVPLEAVATSWGRELAALAGQLAETAPAEAALALLASRLSARLPVGPVQRLCDWLAGAHGQVRIDDLAARANLSGRQLRRLFVAQVGLGPKPLARILRFQHAMARARNAARPDWAALALDCGYADQAHLVHEFGALAGCPPGKLAAAHAVEMADSYNHRPVAPR
jgi:AraC-like DNA-binding protein